MNMIRSCLSYIVAIPFQLILISNIRGHKAIDLVDISIIKPGVFVTVISAEICFAVTCPLLKLSSNLTLLRKK